MPKAPLYNANAELSGTLELPETVFGVKVKRSVVHQVYLAIMANNRRPWADTKDRGQVSGGGKKPWKQKGTGRARQGSIRSPQWKGGGVVFGPTSARNYTQKINKKMNQAAVRMCLSDRVAEERFAVIEALPSDGKTKTVAALSRRLPSTDRRTLFLLGAADTMLTRATKNIQSLDVVRAVDVNVVDVLNHPYIVATKDAVEALSKRLSKQV